MNRYMVFDVGCIECGEDSGIVGFYATLEEAEVSRQVAQKKQAADWSGQHYFVIFDTETLEQL